MTEDEKRVVDQLIHEAKQERHKEQQRIDKNQTVAMVVGLFVSPFALHAMFDTGYLLSAFLGLLIMLAISMYLK